MLHLQEIKDLALQKMAEHELLAKSWEFFFDRAKKRAGCCHFNKKCISLSHSFCKVASRAEILNTLLHEIAHVLVGPDHHHDEIWKAKALKIGCDAEVTHHLNFSEPRYQLGCSRGCWQVPRHRVSLKWVHRNRCGSCGSELLIYDCLIA